MPKMPDLQTFASPVRVDGARAIGGYDISPLKEGNAAITAGVNTLGKGLQAVGNDIATVKVSQDEANDKYQLAMAKASFNIDHTNIQDGLKHDQDYPTLQPRYMEQAQGAQTRWADTITNPRTKSLFLASTGESIASGNATVKNQAFGLEGQTKIVDLNDRGKLLSDQAIADPMNEHKLGKNLEHYGDMVDGLVAQGHITPTQGAQMKDNWAHTTGVGHGLARADIDPIGAINEARAKPGSPEQVDNRIMQIEGPGKDPRSSAVGGFIDSTWLDLIRKTRPDLAQGKADADLLALRADPTLRREMTQAYRNENSTYLKGQGLEATPGNIYLSHFLGPGGAAAVLKANPREPIADVLSKAVGPDKARAMIDANPTVLAGKLAGSVTDWANGKMGGAIPGGGHIYDWLDDNQRRQIVGYAQSKLEENTLTQQSQLKQRIEDTSAEAARSGYAANPVSQSEFVAAKGIVEGPKAYAQYQAGLKLAADVSNVARMTETEQNELFKSYEPQPGEGYAAQAERQASLQKAILTVRKERDADSATYAINRIPAVKNAFDSFSKAIQDPETAPGAKTLAARDYVNKTTDRQIAAGVSPSDVKILPKPMVDQLQTELTNIAANDDPRSRVGLITKIKQLSDMWGDAWPAVMQQLAPQSQPIVRAIAAGADPVAMTRLLSVPKDESPAKILKEQSETSAKKLTTALNAEMAPFLSSMVGAQKDRDYPGYYGLAEKLAALYVRDGDNENTAASKAFKALVGGRYEFRDTWRMPVDSGVSADDVQHGIVSLKADLQADELPKDSPVAVIKSAINDMGLSDNDRDSRTKFARDAVWVTSPDNAGLNLVYGDYILKDRSGKPMMLPWSVVAGKAQSPAAFAADLAKTGYTP